ncbi:MAG TPA: carboxypeptidase regulatory-like domain-containing protein [Rhodanobacter sp.]|nr:carboxypeptidase regulatory-like domain-containing protein [Rhodanobacter sp.]
MSIRYRASAGAMRWRPTALTIAMGLSFSGAALAQSTVGSIFGQAPTASGETVAVTSATGFTREVPVDSTGRYRADNLPVGTYTVTLKQNGAAVSTHPNVFVSTGAAAGIDFATASNNATQLSSVTVTANALPAIDVTNVNSSTVITAADLKRLPVVHNAESIALLAPNTASGSGFFTGPSGQKLVSFGGSSVSENSYYVNGYNVGEPYKNLGGFQLPYGAIEQQETLTGGYDAKYGRSDGGVINQVGKRGTNDWHFGGQVAWSPRFLEGTPTNYRYGNTALPASSSLVNYAPDSNAPGTLRQYRNDNTQWQTIYSAYLGGPLIKDKLYLFLAGETTRTQGTNVQNNDSAKVQDFRNKETKYYAKLDWNITDSNILELTTLKDNNSRGGGSLYSFDYDTLQRGAFSSKGDITKDNAQIYIGHFTSYITDAATLSITGGKAHFQNPVVYGNNSPLPFISRGSNATLPDGSHPNNAQTNTSWVSPAAKNATRGLRVDFDYKLGDHDLLVGMDNMFYSASNQGPSFQNPYGPYDYYWRYLGNTSAQKRQIGWATSMSTSQKAWYLQDNWQVSQNVYLSVGVRNDRFTNYNNLGQVFVDEKNQWEPRIGASWDVFGDSTFKIYGNAGRYYLALPDNAAERAANPSTYLTSNCTFTRIDPATGVPVDPTGCTAWHSPDGETGEAKDPKQVAARNLKPEYVDEFILGFDKKLGDNWVYGAKAMWRDLKAAIDDVCDNTRVATKMTSMGLNPDDYSNATALNTCVLFNPGQTNNFLLVSDDGTKNTIVPMTTKDWGFDRGAVRKYGSLNLYLEHPFDGKWYGRVDYTFTRGFGNTEGQVRSDFGQEDISKTEDWDSWQLMDGQYGEFANVRKHQFRFRGNYQVSPEWLISATLLVQSGMAKECLGYFGPLTQGPGGYLPPGTKLPDGSHASGANDPTGYNNSGTGNYHWCNGQRVTPGSNGHTPWTELLNLGVHYRPAFADNKLGFNLDIFNALNQQRALQVDPSYPQSFVTSTNTIQLNNYYGQPLFTNPPRTVQFSVTYDY